MDPLINPILKYLDQDTVLFVLQPTSRECHYSIDTPDDIIHLFEDYAKDVFDCDWDSSNKTVIIRAVAEQIPLISYTVLYHKRDLYEIKKVIKTFLLNDKISRVLLVDHEEDNSYRNTIKFTFYRKCLKRSSPSIDLDPEIIELMKTS